jgi:hypothetical protein
VRGPLFGTFLIAVAVVLVLLVLLVAASEADAGAGDRGRARAAVCHVFGSRCAPAMRVVGCETGGTYYARSLGRAGERGLFQIHPVHFRTFDPRRLFERLYNARAAFRLSRGGRDWSAWSCRP